MIKSILISFLNSNKQIKLRKESFLILHILIRKLFYLPQESTFYSFSSMKELTYNNVKFDNFDIKQLLLNDNDINNYLL